jgi:perosamine synthetase
VFCDIEVESWCLDPGSVESLITPRTRAIIAVGLYGNMPRMNELTQLASSYGVHLIEDAAESLGSVYHGAKSGSFGVGSVFSFHRTKTLTTGEGGMLLLDDPELFERCMMLRDHGRPRGGALYQIQEVTPKYMPFNLQAALGHAQFQRLGELIARKRDIFARYKARLASVPDLQFNDEPDGILNSVWMTNVVFGPSHDMTKERAMKGLAEMGIPTRPFFYPLTSMRAYHDYRAQGERNRRAYDISDRAITLPCAFSVTDAQIDAVSAALATLLGHTLPEQNGSTETVGERVK